MRLLAEAGYACVVITNQACVGKGLISEAELDAIHQRMCSLLEAAGGRIAGIFRCTHTDATPCPCRKPKPGLIIDAQARFGFDPASTWMVGDAGRDVAAARAAGCRPALVATGKGRREHANVPDVPLFASLAAFASELVAGRI